MTEAAKLATLSTGTLPYPVTSDFCLVVGGGSCGTFKGSQHEFLMSGDGMLFVCSGQ